MHRHHHRFPAEITSDQAVIIGGGNTVSFAQQGGFAPFSYDNLEDRLDLSAFLKKIGFSGRPTYRYLSSRAPDEFLQSDSAGGSQSLTENRPRQVKQFQPRAWWS